MSINNKESSDFNSLFNLIAIALFFIYQNKIKIILVSLISSIIFYSLSYTQDIKYYSESLVTSQNQSSTASGAAASMGALSVMGLNLNQGSSHASDFQIGLELFKSRAFTLEFIEKYNLKKYLVAVKSYDSRTGEVLFDDEKYDKKLNKFIGTISSSYLHSTFLNAINISKKDSFYVIGFTSMSPKISQETIVNLIYEVNEYIRNKNLNETLKTYEYLTSKSSEVIDINTKNIINSLTEEQLKKLALIDSSSEYVLRVIDPAYFPEFRSVPNRVYFLIFGFIFGFFLSVVISLVLNKKLT
jgi:LPS O-antigen subunit length determinant protein (WzzB/FepE family)